MKNSQFLKQHKIRDITSVLIMKSIVGSSKINIYKNVSTLLQKLNSNISDQTFLAGVLLGILLVSIFMSSSTSCSLAGVASACVTSNCTPTT